MGCNAAGESRRLGAEDDSARSERLGASRRAGGKLQGWDLDTHMYTAYTQKVNGDGGHLTETPLQFI